MYAQMKVGLKYPVPPGLPPDLESITLLTHPWVFIPLLGPHLLPSLLRVMPWLVLKNVKLRLKLRLILRPRLPLMPGIHTTDVPAIMEDTTGMEATPEVTMDFHMDMDIMPTEDVLTAMAGPMVLTTVLDLMFMANRKL